MRWIYISPHLDDAVLSAGGFLYEQTKAGNPVEIWTIVCGFPPPGELTPFAQVMHHQWGTGTAEETVNLRRREDIESARIVGAKCVHFDVPDCIYRRGPDGEPLYLDIFVELHDAEIELVDQIAETLVQHLEADDEIICQLGVGRHIDHILVRLAAEKLGRQLWYTADIPYLFKEPETLTSFITGMDETVYPITETGLRTWVDAILAYKSQLSTLFENPELVEKEIHSFYAERNAFPFWRLK